MKKIREIVWLHLSSGASVRKIATACDVGRTTVSEYVARIGVAKLSWPSAGELSEEELAVLFTPGQAQVKSRPLPEWDAVRQQLARKGVTLKLLWEEYRQGSEGAYSYSRFVRIYRRWLRASDLVMLGCHVAGERLFVDWAGMKLSLTDPKTARYRKARCSFRRWDPANTCSPEPTRTRSRPIGSPLMSKP